eukprot:7386851-Prymnesium_polylepis.1
MGRGARCRPALATACRRRTRSSRWWRWWRRSLQPPAPRAAAATSRPSRSGARSGRGSALPQRRRRPPTGSSPTACHRAAARAQTRAARSRGGAAPSLRRRRPAQVDARVVHGVEPLVGVGDKELVVHAPLPRLLEHARRDVGGAQPAGEAAEAQHMPRKADAARHIEHARARAAQPFGRHTRGARDPAVVGAAVAGGPLVVLAGEPIKLGGEEARLRCERLHVEAAAEARH